MEEDKESERLETLKPNSIIFQNCRSLRNKKNFESLKNFIEDCIEKPIIIGLSEIWSPNQEHEYLDGYQKFLKRERNGANNNKGGGVGFFIKKDIEYEVIPTSFIDRKFESLGVSLTKTKTKVVVVYRPPNGDIEVFLKEVEELASNNPEGKETKTLFIGGDMNIDLLKQEHTHTDRFNDTLQRISLANVVNGVTRQSEYSSTQLDTIISSNTSTKGYRVLTDISDHLGVAAEIPWHKKTEKTNTKWARALNMENLLKIKEALNKVKWDRSEKEPKVNILQKEIKGKLNEFAPKRPLKNNNINLQPKKAWMTKEILALRTEKERKHKTAINSKKSSDHNVFVKARREYNKKIREAKKSFIEQKLKNIGGNSREIWNLMNWILNKKGKENETITKLICNGKELTDIKEIANELNTFFINVGPKIAEKISTTKNFEDFLPRISYPHFEFRTLTEEEMLGHIRKMKPKKSTGHDGLSNFALKIIAPGIIGHLTNTINEVILTGNFPHEWKISKVIPIYKQKGSRTNPTNYRPISLVPTLGKLLEKILEVQLRSFLNCYNIFYEDQYGFRASHETGHAVTKTINLIATALSKKKKVMLIAADV